MEYLVTMTTHVPEGTPEQAVDDVRGREAAHSRELAAQGHLLRLWRPPLQPGEWRSVGLFAADNDGQLEEVLASMPLRVWRTDEVTPLSPHPNDPAQTAIRGTAEFLTTFTISIPEGTPGPSRRGHRGARGGARQGTGRAGTPRAAVGAARPGACAGPVASPGRRGDGNDREVAAPGRLDDHTDHTAHTAPERPGRARISSELTWTAVSASPLTAWSHPDLAASHQRWPPWGGQVGGRVDQRHVREGLREVAEHTTGGRVVLFR